MADLWWRDRLLRTMLAGAIALGVSACASLRADTAVARTPLDAPVPPPRDVVVSPDDSASTTPTPVIVPTGPVPASRPARHPVTRPVEKPETPPTVVPEPVATKVPEVPAPGGSLSTSADAEAAERRVRERLGHATRDLKLVDEGSLSSAARTQLEAARRFVTQAEEALATRHYRYAEQLADKAAGIAAGLLKR